MLNTTRILAPALLCLTLGACGDGPSLASVEEAASHQSATPLFEGGQMGSGHRDGTTSEGTTAGEDAQLGGGTYGPGGKAEPSGGAQTGATAATDGTEAELDGPGLGSGHLSYGGLGFGSGH